MLGRKQQRPQAGAGGCAIRQLTALISLAFATLQAHAGEATQPTRTVYRCEEGKKVSYSDAPCLGAKKVDVTPTRGLNKSTGQELTGADVRREHTREQIGAAVRPITGLSTQQFDQAGRRTKLSTEAQQSCRKLDHALPLAEQAERAARSPAELKSAQEQLLDLRKQFREQRCD